MNFRMIRGCFRIKNEVIRVSSMFLGVLRSNQDENWVLNAQKLTLNFSITGKLLQLYSVTHTHTHIKWMTYRTFNYICKSQACGSGL